MPDWVPRIRERLSALQLSPAREAEIVEELSQHLEDRWRELIAAGRSPEEAAQLALADFREGDLLARSMAPLRQSRVPPAIAPGSPDRSLFRGLWRDIRYAACLWRKQPGFVLTAVLTLALALGATTAIFTVVDALLLRPLPFPQAGRLVQVGRDYGGRISAATSVPKFMHWRAHGRAVFVETAAYNDLGSGFNFTGSGLPERLIGSHVSAGFFDVLGVRPELGRGFREDEDVPGGPKLVVLSQSLWKNRLGARHDIVGAAIALNNEPYTVVGVMPDGFRYPEVADLWTLFQFDRASQDRANNFEVVARLRPDVTIGQARGAMQIAANTLRPLIPGLVEDSETVGVRPLRERLYGNLRQPLLILLASAAFVLLIGCVNVANLQLAQASGRRHEIALRTALGASTSALVRQLLVESLLLAAIGGAAGVALALGGVRALLILSPLQIAYAGVRAAAIAHILPLELGSDLPFTIEGKYVPGTQTGVGSAEFRPIGRGYFDTLAIPLRRGRVFDARDRHGTLPVAVINEAAAREIWPDQDPLGQRIHVGQPYVPDLADATAREIIGVVGNVREDALGSNPPAILYVPMSQLGDGYARLGTRLLPFSVVVRGEAVAALTRPVEAAIHAIDPQQPISDVRLMREIVARSLRSQRFNTALLGGLAALALLLAAVGLYGVIAHTVGQQTSEIGVRMALGASRSSVVALFLRQALSMVAIGVAAGLAGASTLTGVLRTLVSGIGTTDPWVFVLAPAVMFAVAVAAALRPALHAATVDPASALRAE